LMDSLASFLKYAMSELMEALDTCSSPAISPRLKPLALISTTLGLLHSNWSAFVLKFQKFPS
jgi:hypothetical protein